MIANVADGLLSSVSVVRRDHPSLSGHFPDYPIVPGVVILERVAAAICTASGASPISSIPSVKFLRPLLPDQEFSIILETTDGSTWAFRCESSGLQLVQGVVRILRIHRDTVE